MITFRLVTPDDSLQTTPPEAIITGIREPVKWADVKLILERDEKWHGCNYNYSDGNLRLEFTRDSACDLIRKQYDKYGSDAKVRFQVVDTSTTPETIDYDGKLDFGPDSVEFKNGRVSCAIIRDDIHQKLSSRWDTPVSLDQGTSLDGKPVFAAPKFILQYPGQYLQENADLFKKEPQANNVEFPGMMAGLLTILPDMTPGTSDKFALDGLTPIGSGIFEIGPDNIGDFAFMTSPGEGSYDLSFSWLFEVNASLTKAKWTDLSAPKFSRWIIDTLLEIRDPVLGNQTITVAPRREGSNDKHRIPTQLINASYKGSVTASKDTKFILYAKFYFVSNMQIKTTAVSVNNLQTSVSIRRTIRTEGSSGIIYMFPDVLRQVFGVVTSSVDDGQVGKVYGSLIDAASINQPLPGPATDYAITSGLHLRTGSGPGYLTQKAPGLSLKDCMQQLYGYHAAGLHYDEDGGIQVEPVDWFYRGGEILQIDQVFSYVEKPAGNMLYAQVEIGYDKYPEEGAGVAYEFNTVRTFQTPTTATDNKLDIKVPFQAAGTAIEMARKLSFATVDKDGKQTNDPTAAGQYDDEVFLIHVQPQTYTALMQFIVTPPQPFPGTPYEKHVIRFSLSGYTLREGDVLHIHSGINAGRSYVIFNKKRSLLSVEVEVSYTEIMGAAAQSFVTYSIGAQPVIVRTNERVEVLGVASPETTYNLELTPDRMLLAHAPLINSGLRYMSATSELQLTQVKHNADLMVRCRDTAGPLPNDPDRLLVYSGKNVPLGKMQRFKRLFSPEEITATVALSKSDFRLLVAALRNQGDEAKRMGYVSIKNDRGAYTKAYVRKMSYNPSSDEVELTLIKRFAIDGSGTDCSDFAGWTFDEFMSRPDADPNFWLFCKFSSLQGV